MPQPNSKWIAAYDFDGTLVTGDTFTDFIRHTFGTRAVAVAFARALPWIIKWKSGLGSGGQAKEKIFGYLFRGMDAAEFARLSREYVPAIVARERAEVTATLDQHLGRGNAVYIVSPCPAPLVEAWAQARDPRIHVMATIPDQDSNGKLTGKFRGKNCRGAEKVERLSTALPQRATYTLEAYGDSSGDIQMLTFADIAHRIR